MKVRRKNLLAVLLCVVLSVTDILPVGFSVTASESAQPDLIPENGKESKDNLREKIVFENEKSTGEVDSLEEFVITEDEGTKEIEFGMGKEEIIVEDTEVQEEENGKNIIELETQEESSTVEETDNNNMESDESEQEIVVKVSGDDIAGGRYGNITWAIDAQGILTVTGTGEFIIGYKPEDGYEAGRSLWDDYSNSIVSAKINVTGATNASHMFYGCSNLTSVDMSGFDTGNVTSMSRMFYGCSNLASVDVSGFDTKNVTDMEGMFSGCMNLTNIDMSSFDTSNVTYMMGMFSSCSNLVNIDVSGFDTRNVISMYKMFQGCNSLTSVDVSGFDTGNVTNMEYMFSECRSLTSVDVSGFDTKNVTNMYDMFGSCNSLTKVDVSGFDTKNVTDMEGMFSGCMSLTNIDASSFDTSNVTSMQWMFSSCSNLVNIDVSSFDTRNVIHMYGMFEGCNSLTSLDVSNFDTSNVAGMGSMFYGCSSLTSLDANSFNTTNVKYMNGMFWDCNSLTSLDISGFDTSNVTNMDDMFRNCNSLTSVDVSSFDTKNVTDMSYMFNGCSSLASLDMSSFDVGNVIECEYLCTACTSLTTIYAPRNLTKSVSLPKEEIEDVWHQSDGTELTELPRNLSYSIIITRNSIPMISVPYIVAEKVKTAYMCGDSLTIDDLTVRLYNTDGTVKGITDYSTNKDEIDMSIIGKKTLIITYNSMTANIELTIIQADSDNIAGGNYGDITWAIDADEKLTVTGTGNFTSSSGYNRAPWYKNRASIISAEINVSDMKNASYMFYGCENLTSIDISGFDTRNVTNMQSMFSGCSSLTSIDINSLDTRNVANMASMFSDCSSLESIIGVSGFDTKNVINMEGMFSGCENLASIDVSGFNTKNVTSMRSMFSGCKGLEDIDLSGFDTENVTDMYHMFGECKSLVNLDLSSFNTRNVINMGWMFSSCSGLVNIDLSSFDVGNVIYMWNIFDGCSSLVSIDMSSFDVGNITIDLGGILDDCSKLTTIYTPYNLSQFVELPKEKTEDVWYKPDGTSVTILPQDISYSIKLSKNDIPTISDPYITAQKIKTVYKRGDLLNIDDLTVKIYNTDGTVKKITDYETNKDEIDMSMLGNKILKVNYNNMEAAVDIVVHEKQDIANGSYENVIWVIDTEGVLTVTGKGDFAKPNTGNNRAPWYENRLSILSAKINVTDTTDASYMFYGCQKLKSVDLKNFDTGTVSSMRSMFDGCTMLADIDLSSFNTVNVTDMGYMFNFCNSLTSVNLTGFDTKNVNDISYIFNSCSNLTSVNLTGFDTGKVTNMKGMFRYCYNLVSVDLGSMDTSSVTDMSSIFEGCSELLSLDVSRFTTSEVTNMSNMFYDCCGLESLDVSGFDTGKVVNMSNIFYGCYGLESLDVDGFNTGKVTNMRGMFSGCHGLEQLDVSQFDTSKVTDMRDMFFECYSLEGLDVSGFDTSKVTNMGNMFYNCFDLTYLDLSNFDVSKIDRVDDEESPASLKYMLDGCNQLTRIYTPNNLIQSVLLPGGTNDTWYQFDGTVLTELPRNLSYSILIGKNSVPTVDASHITVSKSKTIYVCGDVLNIDDLTVRFYSTDGTVKKITDYTTNANTIDMSMQGTKTLVITYNSMTADIELTVTGTQQEKTYTVTFNLCGHSVEIAPITDITAGSLIAEPRIPQAEGYCFMGWYKDPEYIHQWNFNEDTVQENITLYAYWITTEDTTKIGNLFIQKIPAQSYTGSAIKPAVEVYYQSDGNKTLLKAGTDYTVKYFNNIEADTEQEKTLGGTSQTDTGNGFTKDLAYIVITCKGNYTGSVYQNFHITPVSITDDGQNLAEGFTLKYTEQFASSVKALKPFVSLKYKKTMKAGTDYNVKLTVEKAYDDDGNALPKGSAIDGNSEIPAIPAGYQGTFLMTITGMNNYEDTIVKTIYVADKNHLMKNASVSLGKNQKNMKYTGDAVVLTPAWYDVDAKKYYIISEDGKQAEADKNDVFTIKLGTEYLLYGRDFTVRYQRNRAVGTATVIIVGIGDYVGTKNVTFRIMGVAFNTKNIRVSNLSASLIYTGEPLTQNGVILTDISGTKPNELVYGTDYWVTYKNNLRKGTATMTFTAKPISGYSGSFKQTFKITAVGLGEITDVAVADPYNNTIRTENENLRLDGKIIYTKEGAKPSDQIVLTNRKTNSALKEGIDYTVSYVNNKSVTTDSSLATMTIKGKGNYAGIITVSYPIIKAPLSGNENLTVTAVPIAYDAKKTDDYQYLPKVKLMDKKKALSALKDYEVVEYKNCSQAEVNAYLEAVANGTENANARPYAIIKAREESGYEGSLEVDLTIYRTKLTAKNLYIVMPEETAHITYTGKQVKPEVTVYYGEAEDIEYAKDMEETKENILTDKSGNYQLTKLNLRENGTGDYTLVYGVNITAGKNKGNVSVIGAGLYGGKVTAKFTILEKNVY